MAREYAQALELSPEKAVSADISADRLDEFARLIDGWYWKTNPDGQCTYLSKHAETLTGQPHHELIEKFSFAKNHEVIPAEEWRALQAKIANREDVTNFIYRRTCATSDLWLSVSGNPTFDASGIFLGYTGVTKNVTTEHQAITNESKILSRFNNAMEAVTDGVLIFDANERLVTSNLASQVAFDGATEIMKPGRTFEDVLCDSMDRGNYQYGSLQPDDWLQMRLEKFRNPTGPYEHELSDGRIIRVIDIKTASGETMSIRTDVTELSRQTASNARLVDAINSINDGIQLYDAEERLIFVNEHYSDAYPDCEDIIRVGRTFEEILRNSAERGFYDITAGDIDAFVKTEVERFRNPGGVFEITYVDGRTFQYRDYRTADGGTLSTQTEVTKLAAAETGYERLRSAIDGISNGIIFYDADERLTFINQCYLGIYDCGEEVFQLGRKFEDIFRDISDRGEIDFEGMDKEAWMQREIDQFRDPNHTFDTRSKEGRVFQYRDYHTADGGTLITRTDVTKLHEAEAGVEQLRDAINSINVGIVLYDADERLVFANEQHQHLVPGGQDIY